MSCAQKNQPSLECVHDTIQLPDGWWQHTSKCGIVRKTPPEWPTLRRVCVKGDCLPDPPEPKEHEFPTPSGKPIIKKAWSYFWANIKWIKAGRPVRPADEIQRIHAICLACPSYQPSKSQEGHGTCGECGCNLAQIGGVRNKIEWATENCPLEKW